jgi:hypothetical protein
LLSDAFEIDLVLIEKSSLLGICTIFVILIEFCLLFFNILE